MTSAPRNALLVLAVVVAAAWTCRAGPPAAAVTGRPPVPVILDSDIGTWIDDTWALVALLKSPEVDLRLVLTDSGNTVERAKIVARLLDIAGRTDIPIGIGPGDGGEEGGQAEWVRGYDLSSYPGRVHHDGVQALINAVRTSAEPLTLVSISPGSSLKAALEREPGIAGQLRLVAMCGSLRRGDGGKPGAEPEWNVQTNPAAARAVLAAPWLDAVVTPLDTSGVVRLKGARYARVRDSSDPLLRALVENYRLWCPHERSCASDPERAQTESSVLYDTVAVYLALARDLVRTETLGVRVTEDGMTVEDPTRRPITWATGWVDLDAYEDWLVSRLTSPTVSRPAR